MALFSSANVFGCSCDALAVAVTLAVLRSCFTARPSERGELAVGRRLFLARGMEFGSSIDHQACALREDGSKQGTRGVAHFSLHRRIHVELRMTSGVWFPVSDHSI